MGCFGGCGGGYVAPVAGYGGGMVVDSFALIVVLFILLIIIGCVCWN